MDTLQRKTMTLTVIEINMCLPPLMFADNNIYRDREEKKAMRDTGTLMQQFDEMPAATCVLYCLSTEAHLLSL